MSRLRLGSKRGAFLKRPILMTKKQRSNLNLMELKLDKDMIMSSESSGTSSTESDDGDDPSWVADPALDAARREYYENQANSPRKTPAKTVVETPSRSGKDELTPKSASSKKKKKKKKRHVRKHPASSSRIPRSMDPGGSKEINHHFKSYTVNLSRKKKRAKNRHTIMVTPRKKKKKKKSKSRSMIKNHDSDKLIKHKTQSVLHSSGGLPIKKKKKRDTLVQSSVRQSKRDRRRCTTSFKLRSAK